MNTTFRLLALAALLAVVYSRSFVQRIQRHKGHSKSVGESSRSVRLLGHSSSRLKTGSQPLVHYANNFYTGNIAIGSPGQVITVVLDTGSSNLFVFDCNATLGDKNHCYTPQNSTTYAVNGAPFSTEYSLEIAHGHVSGYLGADAVDFGEDLVDVNQTFGIATTDSGYFAEQPVDGIFGLGWPSGSDDNPFRPPLFQVLDQLDKPLFTIWLDGNVSTYDIAPDGLITYGAVDAQNCDAHIDYVPLTTTARWQFQWDGFAVGKSNFPGHQQVITDTGISYLHLLTPHFDAFMKEIGADYQFAYGIFTVDCDAKNLPDIVLTIGGKKYNIPSSEYVLDVDMGENQCTVAAIDIGATSPLDQPTIVLGNLFHRTYCHVYDIGQKRIGFVKSHIKKI